ncbi:MAG: OsmC family protein [Chlorobi bacterium]|nr:OsmC family protein [Chlorobiota bacterium]
MNYQRITFDNGRGEKLAARLDFPVDGVPAAWALFAHCFTCTKNLRAVGNISSALNRERIAVMRFDFTGLGESEGDFADTNFSSNVDDLVAGARFLEENYQASSIIIGHSLGGAAVLQAVSRIPSIRAVATIGAPYNPEHATHLLEGSIEEIEERGEARIMLAGSSFTIKKQFLDDLDETNMSEKIRTLERALLVLHAPLDDTVGIENAASIFHTAKHPKSFVSLDKADHLLSNEDDSHYAGSVIASWAKRYVELPENILQVDTDPTDNRVVVHTGSSGYRTEVLASGHALIADEPLSVGGTNTGPTPYDYLSAALGTCTSMTLRMYADHKKWPLEGVTVRLKHSKVHKEDCEAEEQGKGGKIDQIEREIEVSGDLDQEKRGRLLQIADRCPVHRTLYGEIKVKTRVK